MTNSDFLAMLRDPLVRCALPVCTCPTNGVTNAVLAKALSPEGGGRALVWAYWQDTNTVDEPMTELEQPTLFSRSDNDLLQSMVQDD